MNYMHTQERRKKAYTMHPANVVLSCICHACSRIRKSVKRLGMLQWHPVQPIHEPDVALPAARREHEALVLVPRYRREQREVVKKPEKLAAESWW